jgi:AcrR family transcriptional regulator
LGILERKERGRDEMREKIICAAEELFAEAGYENVSMRKISQKIEYSLPVIYYYFKDKSDILSALYAKRNGVLHGMLRQAAEKQYDDPGDRLKAMGFSYLEFAFSNPRYYELAFSLNVLRKESRLPYREKESEGFLAYALLKDAVEQCRKAGYYEGYGSETVSQMLWAGIHGMASLLIAHDEFEWEDRKGLAAAMLGQLIKK